MSYYAIHFRLLLRARDGDKAQRVIDKAVRLLDRAAVATMIGRYPQDERLFEGSIRANLLGLRAAEVGWDALLLAGRLGSGWLVKSPGAANRLDLFEGIADVRSCGGLALSIEWASFTLIPIND